MIRKARKLWIIGALVAAVSSAVASGAVLLSTDFTGRTVTGSTASTIPWTTSGFTDPGSMTANYSLFDTPSSQGYFAPNTRLNSAAWDTDVALVVSGAKVELDGLALTYQHFNSTGAYQTSARNVTYTITILDSGNTVLFSQGQIGGGLLGTLNYSFGSLTLSSIDTYRMHIVASATESTYSGLNVLSVTGSVVPEPTSLMLTLASVGLILRRRARRQRQDLPRLPHTL